jgi:hypothetical protein
MTIAVGEVGKAFRYVTGFNMSSNTALTLNFTKPDGTTLQKTDLSSNPVTAPAATLGNDPDLGNVSAFTYMEFTTIATDFDQAGIWSVCGIYTNSTTSVFHGSSVNFTILAACA